MRIIVVLATVVIASIFLLPTFIGSDSLPGFLPSKTLNLGLDLRGGIHVVLGVDVEKAIDVEKDHLASQLQDRLDEAEVIGSKVTVNDSREIVVRLNEAQQGDTFRRILNEDFYKVLALQNWETETQAFIRIEDEHREYIKQMSLEQAREIIRNRVDEFGVSEPIIQLEGDDRILVQLPGVNDPNRAVELIGKTALLEYKIVKNEMSSAQLMALVEEVREKIGFSNNFTRAQLEALNAELKSKIPAGTEISFEKETEVRGGQTNIIPYLLEAKTVLTGQALDDARVITNPTNNRPQVSIRFNKSGAEDFEKITEANVGNRLAILLDGVVISAPTIQEKIPALSGGATITLGQGDRQKLMEDARDLSLVLRSGALPAPVEVLENRTVGASLGQDSIDQGKTAGLIAAIVILLFMLFYYRGMGFLADISVSINILMILSIMALFQATLTLPGIAGIVLTVGMAVDGNVIILERIREELRRPNARIRAAVETGYEVAHKAILDSNITTAIAAIVLFNFGSGPIRGFAVTLLIGIICSYICAVWFSRWMIEWYLDRRVVKQLSI